MAAFSVSTSAMISPFFTRSPGFFFHATSLPSVMSEPRIGMTNSAMTHLHLSLPQGVMNRVHDALHAGKGGVFKVFGVGNRHFRAAHSGDGAVEIIEGTFHDLRADLCGKTPGPP